jgi:hypothetical protein
MFREATRVALLEIINNVRVVSSVRHARQAATANGSSCGFTTVGLSLLATEVTSAVCAGPWPP